MNKQSDLARVAHLFADRPSEQFLVVTYEADGAILREVDTVEAPSADAALVLGQTAAEMHPTVIVTRQTEDALGVIRSAVLRTYERK